MNIKINHIISIISILMMTGCTSPEVERSSTQKTEPSGNYPINSNIKPANTATSKASISERKFQNILYDSKLAKAVKNEIRKHPYLSQHSQILIFTFDQEVYLIGSAESESLKNEAEDMTAMITHDKIHNLLLVGEIKPDRAKDLWLETKVKTWLVSSKFYTSSIQAVCFNNTVYLIGAAEENEIKTLHSQLQALISTATLSSQLKPIIKESRSWKD
jgi:osmotically-inducible protein OsmY